jgi:hypothetical protein
VGPFNKNAGPESIGPTVGTIEADGKRLKVNRYGRRMPAVMAGIPS